jgi:hypothetical protein
MGPPRDEKSPPRGERAGAAGQQGMAQPRQVSVRTGPPAGKNFGTDPPRGETRGAFDGNRAGATTAASKTQRGVTVLAGEPASLRYPDLHGIHSAVAVTGRGVLGPRADETCWLKQSILRGSQP